MNCKEFKDLVSETTDLNEISSNAELSAHLKSCEGCRVFLRYEESLRSGFAEIAEAPMPSDITRRILAIPKTAGSSSKPAEITGALTWLHGLVNSFSFKVALASGITGFLFAVLLLREPIRESVGRPDNNFARSEKTKQLQRPLFRSTNPLPENSPESVIQGVGAAITLDPELKKMVMANKPAGRVAEPPEFFKKHEIARAPELSTLRETEKSNMPHEEIPGAVSYSLADEEAGKQSSAEATKARFAFPPEKTSSPDSSDSSNSHESHENAFADASTDFSTSAVLAAAPSQPQRENESEGQIRMAMAPAAPSMRAKSFSEKAEEFLSDSENTNSEKGSLVEDIRASEILKLLESNNLADKEGFIDLERLVMRGFISNRKFRAWQPADGNSWYLTIEDGKARLSLRRKH